MRQKYIFEYYLAKLCSPFKSCLQNLDFQMVKHLYYWFHIEFHETFSNIFISYFSMYLQKYLSYRYILYLKIILKKFCFDHLKCNFALGCTIWAVEIKICVHIFLKKKVTKTRFLEFYFLHIFQCISKSISPTKTYYTSKEACENR